MKGSIRRIEILFCENAYERFNMIKAREAVKMGHPITTEELIRNMLQLYEYIQQKDPEFYASLQFKE